MTDIRAPYPADKSEGRPMAKRAAGGSKRKARSGASKTAGRGKARVRSAAGTVARAESDQLTWTPSRYALWSQRWGDPNDAAPTAVLLRHPTAPFRRYVDNIDDPTMQQLGFDYLTQANESREVDPPLNLPQEWLNALDPNGPKPDTRIVPAFGWLKLGWPTKAKEINSLVSFEADRWFGDRRGDHRDRIVIMLASDRLGSHILGSGFGIRVVAHVRRAQKKYGKKFEVRITGMSASLPFGIHRLPKKWVDDLSDEARVNAFLRPLLAPEVTSTMAAMLSLTNDSIRIQGLRIAPTGNDLQVEWFATGTAKNETKNPLPKKGRRREQAKKSEQINPTPYSFIFSANFQRGDDGIPTAGALGLVSKVELVADAVVPGHARIFPRDPASQDGSRGIRGRRTTRSEAALQHFRREEEITAVRHDPLQIPRATGAEARVVVCPRFVLDDDDPNIKPGDTREGDLPGTGPAVRSNELSAVMAYWNVKGFFERFDAYGILATDYFHIAKLPLELHYRSGIRPGPGKDGQAVNARVLVEGWDANFEGPTPLGARPTLQMHLALANLSTRARAVWNGKARSPAEPLGIASDARWIWHEIGHVLMMASVGELQFRFAHSPGDALAAIVADPGSKLATDAKWRGATFPWVFIPRRHDRCVSHGWSWGGALHYALSQVQQSAGPRRKGYWSEQILSSSLFRLYRCIGGDTTLVRLPGRPDEAARESASHYCVYLIMRGIQILGITGVVPANEPDQFVSALIDADVNTGLWDVVIPPGSANPLFTFHRVGGCVHKVVRWAFEAQGLYKRFSNGLGLPPPVDIFIENYRPAANNAFGGIQYGSGSYFPVSLHWDRNQTGASAPPEWQATTQAIDVNGGDFYVTVGNRGTQVAAHVNVTVWWCKWPAGTKPPEWNNGHWKECVLQPNPSKSINPDDSEQFGPFPRPAPGVRYVLLAMATCADDPANTDTTTLLPCSQEQTPLVDLVANDNNLGLRVLGP